MFGNFRKLVFAIRLFNTSERISEFELRESATGDQKSDAVGGCPVGEAVLDSIALELVCVGGAKYLVARNLGGENLADNIFVREADNEAVFGSVVFVLSLSDETLASVVISLSCSTTLVLGLVAAVLQSVASYRRGNAINDTYL